ncbi:MAG: histone deacetylase [Pirellulales bacterium]|nr:histone deacetylase [Pirellulales bacterium]
MTLLYQDPRFLLHDTGPHPECAERLRRVTEHLESTGLTNSCTCPAWQPVTDTLLRRVHQQQLLALLENLVSQGGGKADADTVVSSHSVDVAKLAAGAASDAVQQVLAGAAKRALCLVRPPGHHALANRAMGFCLFNNIAVAAQAALDAGVERILIVDWDVHHGNGTQAIFYNDPRVGYFSAHRWPFYPGTGSSEESGTNDGLGATRNLPVAFGTPRDVYQAEFVRALEDFAARIRPEFVLVSAGFDSHRADPIGALGLEVEDFRWLTSSVVEIANTYAQGRVVSTLEGGYNPPVLAECVATHLEVLRSEA